MSVQQKDNKAKSSVDGVTTPHLNTKVHGGKSTGYKTLKFSKKETTRFDGAIRHIEESLKDNTHDFHSALYCSGITYTDDIQRFNEYTNHKYE